MIQHMVLIVVIAPLGVLTRPLPQLVAGGLRAFLPLWRPVLRLVRQPMLTAYLHGFAIWVWHLPWFYMLAVESPGWHTFEHICFLATAGLFWWAVLRSSSRNLPTAALALLFTLMHTGFLGAILTFSRVQLYDESRTLADQQLAGLIMWVAGAFPYLLGISWLARRWYQRITP
jgi:cytochrome c oxidase assembly factor CtaG